MFPVVLASNSNWSACNNDGPHLLLNNSKETRKEVTATYFLSFTKFNLILLSSTLKVGSNNTLSSNCLKSDSFLAWINFQVTLPTSTLSSNWTTVINLSINLLPESLGMNWLLWISFLSKGIDCICNFDGISMP
jgi:hypothetical protein